MKSRQRLIIPAILILLLAFYSQTFCQDPDSTVLKRKNPTGALFRSLFVPGWGQFYNGKYIKAVVIAGIEVYLINEVYTHWHKANLHEKHFTNAFDYPVYQAEEFAKYEKELDRRGNATWFLAATVFLSMFDAYVDAHLSDFDQPDKAFEVYIGPGHDDDILALLSFNLP
ncbi:MAG: hypothetical protein JSW64_06960 [Candidatus Zixiibacteriota bacterium]|nr:MAG: hypothetical protein JSW64_06960 [candidate division Zixibacteria bacterium]